MVTPGTAGKAASGEKQQDKDKDGDTGSLGLKFLDAINKERQADLEQTDKLLSTLAPKQLAARGLAVLNLVVSNLRTGLGGKTILELEIDSAIVKHTDSGSNKTARSKRSNKESENDRDKIKSEEINISSNFRVGDIVKVEKTPSATSKRKKQHNGKDNSTDKDADKTAVDGVVTRVSSLTVNVSLSEQQADKACMLEGKLWMVKLSNSITFTRMTDYMRNLELKSSQGIDSSQLSLLQNILIGKQKPSIPSEASDIEFLDPNLNQSQKDAVAFAIGSSEIALVHGPPGTGKTFTVIEIIRQLLKRSDERILVCGPSNISVDTILERLGPLVSADDVVRIGHPARLLPTNLRHSLDIAVQVSEEGQIVKEVRQEIDSELGKIKKTRNGQERRQIYQQVKDLRKDYKRRERKVVDTILNRARVVVSTLHGAGSQQLLNSLKEAQHPFTSIIIDEVSQSLEPQCWIPVLANPQSKRLILAGDNKQLPPTIKSNVELLSQTLFDRLLKLYGPKYKRMLKVQYRMNEKIMEFPSKEMYGGNLEAACQVANRKLCDIPKVIKTEETDTEVVWIDTQGGEFPESEGENNSKYNETEAYLVFNYVDKICQIGNVDAKDVGIISPYSAQVGIISNLLKPNYPEIEISTVDGFQGREKEIIIISLVRSNDIGQVGFLSDSRRLNVAMTRPKRHLCIIGDMETLSRSSKFLNQWVKWAELQAEIRYPDLVEGLSRLQL